MNIDDLKPGRALDALIAAKVMGWTVEHELDGKSTGRGSPDVAGRQLVPVQKYSTDIAAAWEVVDKLGLIVVPRKESHSEIPLEEDREPKRIGWAAGRCSWSGPKESYLEVSTRGWEEAPTAALAICRAALKAVGA